MGRDNRLKQNLLWAEVNWFRQELLWADVYRLSHELLLSQLPSQKLRSASSKVRTDMGTEETERRVLESPRASSGVEALGQLRLSSGEMHRTAFDGFMHADGSS